MRHLALLCLATCTAFLTVGLPLPVISLFVHEQLGYSSVLVGTAVGIQFLATVLTRGHAGRQADTLGARPILLKGLLLCAASGLFYIGAAWLPLLNSGRFSVLILGRLTLGYGESLVVAGMLAWGIGTVGAAHSGRVMAWTGMAIYSAFALGAPIGLMLYGQGGLPLVGLVVLLLPGLGLLLIQRVPVVAVAAGVRRSFASVLGRIWQPGLALALQGVGFAAIGAFISLHFAEQGWRGAGLALTCFGIAYAFMRLVGGHLPDRLGGPPVALASLAVQSAGLWLLAFAPNAPVALLGAAIAGGGCSLVFPALGLVVVARTEPQVRATALGGYAAFQDIAYGVTGPITGLMVGSLGFASAFMAGALAAMLGWLIALWLWWQGRQHAAAGPANR
ncbi:arabinose transporter [Alcanivorax quisquiliarum]|uniref:Uncharacterized MFS-type transporter MU846_08460 n=1 Tax=Alcanivorax quisquiliarum TaxID=2933565 RepID=A0ABT0E7C6_9GAMM|nr:arabinose transporter [Alcanivorax quisquiliarum]